MCTKWWRHRLAECRRLGARRQVATLLPTYLRQLAMASLRALPTL